VPTWTRGRVRAVILIGLVVTTLLVLASLIYFRAGPRVPEGSDTVRAAEARWG
jgi:hypothetical protein